MARTPSNMLPLGTKAPDFVLFNPETKHVENLQNLKSDKATIIVFMCNHCPFVIHIMEELTKFSDEYLKKGVSIIGINANDPINYPADSPEKMVEFKSKYGFDFKYLFDKNQDVAKAYDAACTPDFYLFDGNMDLVYRGQFDDSRPESDIPVTGKDLRAAVDAVLENKPVSPEQKPSIGCNIKWRSDEEKGWRENIPTVEK